ncbi:MAG: 4-alpha-glucanotransferase [Candidatus Abyssobacteria bacterium SURF_5]|uniref:4-alpha-glucanotransferase n=1 Tax=Abyssobacteria bacterium (strain SURF_5) TaxID=2093360 RepID=A0A3A4NX74_ABYX5|nr:MAG: 4-alpha-glucanotransferase [Candidatus Abyssubacteria bacterium SURF_5]
MKRRASGILLHVTSLPSRFGIGDMGPEAHHFAEFLARSMQTFWQILPLNPTEGIHSHSPYHTTGAFACNSLIASPELLVDQGLLESQEIASPPEFPANKVDYDAVASFKKPLFLKAFERFRRREPMADYNRFCHESSHWLDSFALFMALKHKFNGEIWSKWPAEFRDRHPDALLKISVELAERIELEKFLQYISYTQWALLKKHCNHRGIQVIGDLPIYVDYDSADVWTHPYLFKLDEQKRPYVVAGVPPDYFSQTGQLWGNPIYRWDVLKGTGYDWWIRRIEHCLKLYDFVRIDHFRGFVAYWEVPVHEKTAVNGRWVEAPALDFFHQLMKKFPYLPIVAEDLGTITADVREVISRFDLPGMKLLMFAFGDDMPSNPYIPHNYEPNYVAYTGTHDNNTVRGWFDTIGPEEKKRLFQYLGREVAADQIHWDLIRLLMMSVASLVIFPMQDILGLGEDARMNLPATRKGNWQWRLAPNMLTENLVESLGEATRTYGRA